jgi:hypothetical protein
MNIDLNADLTVIWALIIVVAVFVYVVLDGFDLGIGILFPTFRVGKGRNRAMNSIAPVWDGNVLSKHHTREIHRYVCGGVGLATGRRTTSSAC